MRYLCHLTQLTVRLPIALAICLFCMSTEAAVMTYDISHINSYIRERNDVATGLPVVSDARTTVSGQIQIDTVTGQLFSANIGLANYSERYDWDPFFNPNSDYAVLNYSGESQVMTSGLTGTVNGTTISFTGANAWSGASTLGSVSCAESAGTNGDSICSNAAVLPWGTFDIDLDFNADFSSFVASTTWSDTDGVTNDFHQLDMLASVSEVPLPAAGWLMMSGLLTLVLGKSRQRSLKLSKEIQA